MNSSKLRTSIAYLAMLGVAFLIFVLVRDQGGSLAAPALTTGAGFGSTIANATAHPLLRVLVALVVITLCGRVVGSLFRRIGQPPVIGEVISGIMLGPSLLGRVWPEAQAFILPANIAPLLSMLAQVGVVLYLFIVGLALDTRALRGKEHTTVAISHASIVLPFTLGAVLALHLYPRVATSDVPFTVFALFVGVSMSVTAFPVLARILTDRRVHKTRLGVIALTCAAADDVTAWCLLAFIVGFARADVNAALVTIGLTVVYAAFAVLVLKPRIERWLARHEERGGDPTTLLPVAIVGLLLSALATEAIGVHALFGAFVFGAIIPADSALAKTIVTKLEDLVTVLFLPAYFAFTGMRTQIGLVSGVDAWLLCALIVFVASFGKFVGSAVAARATGLDWRDASALGILMNTRGLMELVVLNLGYDLKILSPQLFAMLVIMAVVTTVATAPVLSWITRRAPWRAESEAQVVA